MFFTVDRQILKPFCYFDSYGWYWWFTNFNYLCCSRLSEFITVTPWQFSQYSLLPSFFQDIDWVRVLEYKVILALFHFLLVPQIYSFGVLGTSIFSSDIALFTWTGLVIDIFVFVVLVSYVQLSELFLVCVPRLVRVPLVFRGRWWGMMEY